MHGFCHKRVFKWQVTCENNRNVIKRNQKPQQGCSIKKGLRVCCTSTGATFFQDISISKVVSTHRNGTHPLQQPVRKQAVSRESFHSWGPGDCRTGVRYRGVLYLRQRSVFLMDGHNWWGKPGFWWISGVFLCSFNLLSRITFQRSRAKKNT